jgi:adenosylcobinamide kinase/adenosylcobinamide-phosphate guanylyltransferase
VPVILIGGGARSGKSTFALRYARRLGEPRLFIATAQAFDDEMRVRIARHREERGNLGFSTIEEPVDLLGALGRAPAPAVVLVDCLTLWLSNLLLAERSGAGGPHAAGEQRGGDGAGAGDAARAPVPRSDRHRPPAAGGRGQ